MTHATQNVRTLLLCTLGMTWAVIPEILGFIALDILDLYADHPDRETMDKQRRDYKLRTPDEIWVVTTPSTRGLDELETWWQQWCPTGKAKPNLRVWIANDARDLLTQADCEHFREVVFRVALHAREKVGLRGHVYMSLAGGRKTMSADLQYAAQIMGCEALLHVVSKEYKDLPQALKESNQVQLFCKPLSSEVSEALSIIINGRHFRSSLLDLSLSESPQHPEEGPLNGQHFPLPLTGESGFIQYEWSKSDDVWLWRAVEERQIQGEQLLENYLTGLQRQDLYNNWYGLYRVAPALIQKLRETPLKPSHRELLRQLPKADLHAHLGGYLDLAGQKVVAASIWAFMSESERNVAQSAMARLLSKAEMGVPWPPDIKKALSQDPFQRSQNAAYLLHHLSLEALQQQLFPSSVERVGLKDSHGFAAYERPGDLSGSTLLSHSASIQPFAQQIRIQMEEQGIYYLELRGSPTKYRSDGLSFLRDFQAALEAEGLATTEYTLDAKNLPPRMVRFIVIADRRHDESVIRATVDLAVRARQELNGFVVGIDLAGDEQVGDIDKIARAFESAFRACLHVTIHAGEGMPAQNIWDAAYLLHAERIGHGLTLAEAPDLVNKFRDRGICLELCPTSNIEVVGYKHPNRSETYGHPKYPLRELLDMGLHLAICTDNPGISRTQQVDEYLLAVSVCEKLKWWDILALIRRSFLHSFLPYTERAQLIKHLDQVVVNHMRQAEHQL
jgi:adenosine deaminase